MKFLKTFQFNDFKNLFKIILIIHYDTLFLVHCITGPEFVKLPPNIQTFTNNSGTAIDCTARGVPPPTVVWIGLNHMIVHNIPRLREAFNNGTLYIAPFSASQYRVDVHAASYQCKASSSVGTILAPPTSLRAVVVQDLEVQLYDEYATSGNSVIMTCVIPPYIREHVTVTSWERDASSHIYPSLHGDGKYHVIPDGRLIIHRVQASFSHQTFRCRVLHKITENTAISNFGRVIVSDAHERSSPRIITKDEVLTISSESPLIVPCVAQGHPTPKYRWFIKQNRGEEPQLLENENLHFQNIKHYTEEGVLIITSLPNDLLTFSLICEAYNDEGSSTLEVGVNRVTPIDVIVTPKLLIVDSGSNGRFQCSISGFSQKLSVSWYKNGDILQPSSRILFKDDGKVLEIQSVGTTDAGMYQCFVQYQNKVKQSSAELRLGASPPELIYRFIQQTMTEGPSVSLKCIAKASPTPVFDWFLDGFPLPQYQRVMVGQYVTLNGEVVSHVNISRSKVTDGGEYTCKAQNSVGSVSHSAPLFIYGPPHIRNMGTLTAISGESFKVKCPVAGYPIASVIWRKGGRDLPLNKRHKTSGAVLEIEDISRSYDEGEYTCVASDKHGRKATQTVSVRVVVPPTIKEFEFGHLLSGMRAQVTCFVQTGDPPMEVSWLRNSEPFVSGQEISIHQMDAFTSILVLPTVLPRHSGNYTCVAKNDVRIEKYTARLDVRVAPYWKIDPMDVEIVKGKDAVLECLAEGYPFPNVVWKKGSGSIETQNIIKGEQERLKPFSNGTLLIRKATENDEGTYLCEVTNDVGKGLSALLTLRVFAPPEVKGEETIEARRGENVVFKCHSSGDAPLALTFSKDGYPVDPANVRYTESKVSKNKFLSSSKKKNEIEKKIGEYSLFRVTPLDSGKYACTASNPYGSKTVVTTLVVQDAPGIPRNLRAIEEGSRHVVLSWASPSSEQSVVEYYLLHVKKVMTENNDGQVIDANYQENFQEIKISSAKSSSFKLTDLLPHSNYQIQLIAVNNVGKSPPSEILIVTTEGEAPSGSPDNLRAVPISPTEVKLIWSAPDPKSWHGKILGYYVGHKKINDKQYIYDLKTTTYDKNIEVFIKGLQRFTRYSFVVRAFNAHGQGPSSIEASATTQEDIPLRPPKDLTCVTFTSTTVELSWSPVPKNFRNGKIETYSIFYLPLISGSFKPLSQITTKERIVIGNLLPFTNYSFTVTASTRAGMGVSAEPILCTTEEDVPGVPSLIKAVPSGPETIVVAWAPPLTQNGVLTKYTLFYQTENERNPNRRTIPPKKLWVEIARLSKGRTISFWLTSSTRVGESVPTRKVSAAPTEAVPAGIHAVDQTLRVALGTDVLLLCPSSGYPQPKLEWKINGINYIEYRNKREQWVEQVDGSFLVRNSRTEDSNNFTCNVANYHGSDQVNYFLQILVPPPSFRLKLESSGPDYLKIFSEEDTLKLLSINRMILTWKPSSGEWKETAVPWYMKKLILSDLLCGTEYQLYVTAYNEIGAGESSAILTARTRGERPSIPTKDKILFTNSSSASLYLSAFNDDNCPVKEYSVRMKTVYDQHWTTESGRISNENLEFVLPNLKLKTKYILEVFALNDAGETKAVYSFHTSPIDQEEMYEGLEEELTVPEWNNSEDLYSDPAFIIPVIISCLALIVIIGAIGICCLKKPASESSSAIKRNEKLMEVPDWKNKSLSGTLRKVPVPIKGETKSLADSSECTDGEIHPYATFQLKSYEDLSIPPSMTSSIQTYGRSAMHLQTCINAAHDQQIYNQKVNTRPRPHSLSRGSEYSRSRHETDDYDESGYTDSDIDTLPSSKASDIYGGGRNHRSTSRLNPSSVGRSAHHNMLYIASDVSSLHSPEREKKSLPRKLKGR